MTKSKKKRESMLARTIPNDDLGPNFYANLTHGLVGQLKFELSHLLQLNLQLHDRISSQRIPLKPDVEFTNQQHERADRSTLIEGMIIVDSLLGEILSQYQVRKLSVPKEKIQEFSKPDDGLKDLLKQQKIKIPQALATERENLNNFRRLRNQFAHHKIGQFVFSAKLEPFERFLNNLEGIELQNSMHVTIDGNAGVFVPYNISSGKFIYTFQSNSIEFITLLMNFMFPDEL
jgi:hypothetical protein